MIKADFQYYKEYKEYKKYKEYCKAKKISICKASSMIEYRKALQKSKDFEKELEK